MAGNNESMFEGVSVTDLGIIFRMDRKDVRARIMGVRPSGTRGPHSIFRIRDVAGLLLRNEDIGAETIERVLQMRHTDLPKMLAKEYWIGQSHRLKVLQAQGELWDTAAVVELASEVFKTLRLSLMLASDAVERETGLTEKQREVIENIIHSSLTNAREKLIVSLTERRENTGGKAFTPQEDGGRGSIDDDDDDDWSKTVQDTTGL